MNKMKRLLSVVLALLLAVQLLPLQANAATDGYYTYVVTNGEAEITQCNDSISGDVTIPSTLGGYPVTKIGYAAFAECYKLTGVTIPYGVTIIGESAFNGCSRLTGVTIPDSVVTIGKLAFYNCALTSITIPDSVITIGDSAFGYCQQLKTVSIGKNVASIGESAFWYCRNLTSVTIPGSVTAIQNETFGSCAELTSVELGNGVVSIAQDAFYYCQKLQSVTIPSSVTKIEKGAFVDCPSLTDVYYVGTQEQWEMIQIDAVGNEQLAAATIHYQPKETPDEGGDDPEIGGDDPDNGEDITEKLIYKINNGKVTIINCENSVTGDIVIPAQIEGCPVTQIGSWAFDNCTGLTSVTIPDSVTVISEYAFTNCTGLTNLTIPDSVTSLGQGAFQGCSGLTAVTIGSGITTLGAYLFDDCTSLVDVAIPVSIVYIDGAFGGCYNLRRVYYAGTQEQWWAVNIPEGESNLPLTEARIYYNTVGIPDEADRIPECLYYQVVEDQVIITYCDPIASGQLVIPAVIEGYPVTQIGEYAFQNCVDLTEITIPASVTAISDFAFDNCSGLTAITIPDGVTTIPKCAFRYCYSLADVNLGSGITTIGSNAFVYCTGLTDITLPDSVTTISDYAFYCSNLKNLDFGSRVTTIGFNAFGYCLNLSDITLPDSVTTISDYAFYCSSLANIHIPDSVTSIGARAFYGTELRSVTIPEGITEIGEYVFAMTQLSSVTIPESVTSIGNRAFWQCYVTTIYYAGTQQQWDAITIGSDNDMLLYATLHTQQTQGSLQVQEDGTLLLTGNLEMEELEVLNDQVLDLNGKVLTLDNLASFGQIIDSVGGGGLIVENIEITSNEWLPIQDESGCYRFYEHEANNLGTKETANSTIFGFTLDFANSDAYYALAESEDVQITVTLAVGENSQTYAFSRELVSQYVALVAEYPMLRPFMKLTITGIEHLADGTALTVTPTITAVGGKIQMIGESMQYIA